MNGVHRLHCSSLILIAPIAFHCFRRVAVSVGASRRCIANALQTALLGAKKFCAIGQDGGLAHGSAVAMSSAGQKLKRSQGVGADWVRLVVWRDSENGWYDRRAYNLSASTAHVRSKPRTARPRQMNCSRSATVARIVVDAAPSLLNLALDK
jgi:hypothetical protein